MECIASGSYVLQLVLNEAVEYEQGSSSPFYKFKV